MEIASEKILSTCDYNSVSDFLQYCQKLAIEKGLMQIASISLPIERLDPLAALQSIYNTEGIHFYFEHPENDFAIATTEVALHGVFEGPERFKRVKDFASEVLENTIIFGDREDSQDSLVGPHFITSFTFNDVAENNDGNASVFHPARIFLPAWQLVRSGSRSFLTANVGIDSESDIEFLAQEVWSAYLKFNSFDGSAMEMERESKGQPAKFKELEVGGIGWHEKAVEQAIEYIVAGEYEKIVIARAVDIVAKKAFDPLRTLNRLRQVYPLCRSCFITNGIGQSFICATPERLLKVANDKIITEALAGSIARGSSEVEDEALGKVLLESSKDIYEHQLVVDSIVERLRSLGINPEFNNKPQLKKLANVQHLHTPIEAKLPKEIHFLDVASKLHPTPAVCGTPLEASRKAIAKIENFDRGLYAGVLGFFDYKGNGELVVGIRSALLDGCKARLYAGGGIVNGSNADNERRETDIKLGAMLGNLR